ncbi:ABC1-domain-containing protein [Hortaea werneckii]|nr:ABC1-domain-containing protein [Hortaea werneckii]KAI7000721.1 ABC1-domain-containing protein [Hortaea werneckii]KAI7148586.1 ABC1-domain-containing protein [Hortaea werneckii]KAI7179870.1 ABC1-domain-containing protein [Hortaea werneckii]
MAGRRLIDAAKLFGASGNVAKQHLAVRRQQWDVYSRTSTLAKAVKDQTDRVTVTAAAAIELAKRFNETGPSWQQQQRRAGTEEPARPAASADATRPKDDTAHGPGSVSNDAGSSHHKRELQRRAESQIPSQTADAQPSIETVGGEDTFNERPESASPGLSSLPRSKLPKHADDQPVPGQPEEAFLEPEAGQKPDPQNVPQDVNVDVFSSPRISSMLNQSGQGTKNPYAGRRKAAAQPLPEMVAAQERWQKERASVEPQESQTSSGDAETQNIAAAIAKEAQETAPSEDVSAKSSDVPYEMRESRVPSSRFGRLWQYSGLATSMAFGAVGESFRRLGGAATSGSLMLSEGNMNRLVAKLSRMRGAALKLGQMISFQDSKVLPPAINTVLQRVQDSADYMPPSQRNQVLVQNLGESWRDLFSHFEEKPFAAASIGQVHKATLASNGKAVAVKVQYPGVRNSIDSDLNNLSLLLTASRLLPKGLFLDKTIANAREELGWECDYEREANACLRFHELLGDEGDVFAVPEVYTEACGPGVLTAEFMTGTAVTKIKDLTQHDRDWVGTQILRLCLRELMEWRFMQTDPNWTNFLYNPETQKLELLDFGASREYPDKFVEPYVSLLIAASRGDRDSCRDLSIQLGYLTGHESKAMLQAHVDSIMTLAEPFVGTAPEVYDFENQTITDRVRANIGLMLNERLAPPPEETYSLHRKLSGAFLLCARLRSKVHAREMFANAVRVWDGRAQKIDKPYS